MLCASLIQLLAANSSVEFRNMNGCSSPNLSFASSFILCILHYNVAFCITQTLYFTVPSVCCAVPSLCCDLPSLCCDLPPVCCAVPSVCCAVPSLFCVVPLLCCAVPSLFCVVPSLSSAVPLLFCVVLPVLRSVASYHHFCVIPSLLRHIVTVFLRTAIFAPYRYLLRRTVTLLRRSVTLSRRTVALLLRTIIVLRRTVKAPSCYGGSPLPPCYLVTSFVSEKVGSLCG